MAVEQVTTTKSLANTEIHEAEYNPRQLSPVAEARIKKGMKRFGLVGDLVVNKRTAQNGWPPEDRNGKSNYDGYRLVSGHQRMKVMRKEAKGKKFKVQCVSLSLSPARERELNIFLNNAQAQGEWDYSILEDVLHFDGLDPLATGFDPFSLELLFGASFDGMFADANASAEEKKAAGDTDALAKAALIQEMKDRKKDHAAADNAANLLGGTAVTFVFAEPELAAAAVAGMGLAQGDGEVWFYSGDSLSAHLGLPLAGDPHILPEDEHSNEPPERAPTEI